MSTHQRQQQTAAPRVNDTQNNLTESEDKDENGDGYDETGHGINELVRQSTGTASADVNQTKISQRRKTKISDKPQTSGQHKVKDNNNCQAAKQNKISSECSRHEASQNVNATPPSLGVNLKTSIYDWDSPSSFTGTVKRRSGRRPHSLAATTASVERGLGHANVKQNAASESSALSVKALTPTKDGTTTNHNYKFFCNNKRNHYAISANNANTVDGSKLKRRTTNDEITFAGTVKPASNMPKSHRLGKDKSSKLRHSKSLASADRNANNAAATSSPPPSPNSDLAAAHSFLSVSQHSQSSAPGTRSKSSDATSLPASYNRNLCNASFSSANQLHDEPNAIRDANYMELSFCDGRYTGDESTQFTELFRDFPVSYESTTVVTNSQFAKCGLSAQASPRSTPPYREPPPPTPPPISQMPTRDSRFLAMQSTAEPCASLSAPATPSRGKVVLSKKERKELSKLNARLGVYDGSEHAGGSASAQSSPYKGRVSELKNCLARGLFASLSRGSQKSLTANSAAQEEATSSSNEVSPPPPAPADASPPNSNASNNNDADYSEKLKNLPVRQRKTHVSHMDNYCLFDPVDFINEKALRQRTHEHLSRMFETTTTHGLRDPLFSSRQNLDFSEEESVPEVIYNEDELPPEDDSTLVVEVTFEEACGGATRSANFDHHNYFVIDPDDFEEEPIPDIGIPNPNTNEQLVHANLEALAEQTTAKADEPILRESASFEKLLEVLDAAPSMSNSQESKDTNTTASTTTTTSTALVESSTSTNSASSSTSATSSQTTLQRTKKRLTFLNLSPFRSKQQMSGSAVAGNDKRAKRNGDNKTNDASACDASAVEDTTSNEQRAVSVLVSSEHMLHLQHMLLDEKEHLRARTVPIESNYVLFNPGPVPSRNVPYKIRKPRPLSSHSDADSGFLSPCSPDELSALKFNSAILVLQQCDSVQGYIEIYTDWANYYLERAKSKKRVTDLSADCRDGLLLADVIEAVTSFKVPDLVKKPKNQQQMYDNVNSCLNVLRSQAVCGVDNITTNDICAGRLKAVLALFFALSRYKQQSKQLSNTTTPNANIVLGTTNTTANCTTTAAAAINTATGGAITAASNQAQNQQQQQQHLQNGNETMLNSSEGCSIR
ncbi:serine-rich adhesin for platelets-like [Rhagoletis pomonella]|uniref:serine-rich adhesin for platelets-like n=1 Tax=Rhagoletis pomonella TaxID=28610 RepID=UPI0017808E2E|nr:serine-rich adhesin for platelets-like [Rhagoletis pomonella]